MVGAKRDGGRKEGGGKEKEERGGPWWGYKRERENEGVRKERELDEMEGNEIK